MKTVTPKQIKRVVDFIDQSEISFEQFQVLLGSGRFTALLEEFTGKPPVTITPLGMIRVEYSSIDELAPECGDAQKDFNDKHFPIEKTGEVDRELFLLGFDRGISDNDDPLKSDLCRELLKLGFMLEGPPELCAVAKRYPNLQRKFCIVARQQGWRDDDGDLVYPYLYEGFTGSRCLDTEIAQSWSNEYHFLVSRVPDQPNK